MHLGKSAHCPVACLVCFEVRDPSHPSIEAKQGHKKSVFHRCISYTWSLSCPRRGSTHTRRRLLIHKHLALCRFVSADGIGVRNGCMHQDSAFCHFLQIFVMILSMHQSNKGLTRSLNDDPTSSVFLIVAGQATRLKEVAEEVGAVCS